jgi:hypothetical protein
VVVWCVGTLIARPIFAAEEEIPADFKTAQIDRDVLRKDSEARYRIIWDELKQGRSPNVENIDELRQAFWSTYPDKKGHAEAREALAQALYLKDMMYLRADFFLRIIAGDDREIRAKGVQGALHELMGFPEIDDGIPKTAQPEFLQWVEASVRRLGPARRSDGIFQKGLAVGSGVLSDEFRKAAAVSGKEYQTYLVARDWSEFDRVGRVPASFDRPQTYGIYLYYRTGRQSFADARATYAGFVDAMGKEIVEAAAEAVRKAGKTPDGRLKTNVPEPYKIGPGGSKVEDYDVPYPPGVIGVYSDPLVAMERQATEGSDERYLLFLLSARFRQQDYFSPEMRKGSNQWSYARSLLHTLVSAFGEKDVMEAAHAVHAAKRRLLTGSIMNQAALGATRNDPLECFEDILARKNPAGYLKCALAVKENPVDPGAVKLSAAYSQLIARSNEQDLLAAARKMAGDKPHLASRYELDNLIKAIGTPVATEQPSASSQDFAPYQDWKRFPAGTKVSYVSRTWLAQRGAMETVTPRGWPDHREMFTLQSVTPEQALLWRTEQVFDWNNGAAHPPRDTEIAYPAKATASSRGARQAANPAVIKLSRLAPGVTVGAPEVAGGEEDLVVGGRKLHTTWKSETFTAGTTTLIVKTWTSDEIPTGLVRRLEDTITVGNGRLPTGRSIAETYLESIAGISPGSAAADLKQTLPPPGPLPPELAARLRPTVAKSPTGEDAGSQRPTPSPTPSTDSAPTSPRPTPTGPRPPATPPGSNSAQAAFQQRYSADLTRANRDFVLLNRKLLEDRGRSRSDVVSIRSEVQRKLAEAAQANATRKSEQADAALDAVEASLTRLEESLK